MKGSRVHVTLEPFNSLIWVVMAALGIITHTIEQSIFLSPEILMLHHTCADLMRLQV